MIAVLRAGMRVRLPSGNVVVLQRREQGVWLCEFAPGSRLRGEVDFSETYLRKFGEKG